MQPAADVVQLCNCLLITIPISYTLHYTVSIYQIFRQLRVYGHLQVITRTVYSNPCVYMLTVVYSFMGKRRNVKKVKMFLCLINQALRHEGVWRRGCINPHTLGFGTRWRWVISLMPRPLYPWGNSSRSSLDRRLGGPQNQSGMRGEEKNLALIRTRNPIPLSSSP
jgi:hypothetical protein